MKRATITQLKNSLSELLDIAKNGEPVLVFDRTTPIVKMISAVETGGKTADEALISRLERRGALMRGDSKKLAKLSQALKPVKTKKKVNLIQAIFDEREEK